MWFRSEKFLFSKGLLDALFYAFFHKKKYESTPRRKAFFLIERYAFMRRETMTTTREDTRTHQRRGGERNEPWRIFAFLYLFVLCGCCTTSAVLFTLFLFVFFAPSSSVLLRIFLVVLFALVAPPAILKTDFFVKRVWRRKAERRGS